jgi:hypothetical protein
VASKIEVDRVEFIILAETAGINRVPMVASYSHYGTPVQDIPREFEEAEQRCRQRGLIDHGGRINDRVWELIGVYPNSSVEFDLRFSTEKETEVRAAVSQAGDVAVRTVVDGDRITLDAVRPNDMISALMSVLPEVGPARIRPPLSIELSEMRAAMAEAQRRGDSSQDAIEQELRSRGVSVGTFRKITQILDGPRLGAGEAGVTIWGRERKEFRGDQTMKIIDLPSGRVAIYNSGNQRMLAGCDIGTFQRILGGLVTETQRDATW